MELLGTNTGAFDYREKKKKNRPIVLMGGTKPQQDQGNQFYARYQDLALKYQSGEGGKEKETYPLRK